MNDRAAIEEDPKFGFKTKKAGSAATEQDPKFRTGEARNKLTAKPEDWPADETTGHFP